MPVIPTEKYLSGGLVALGNGGCGASGRAAAQCNFYHYGVNRGLKYQKIYNRGVRGNEL